LEIKLNKLAQVIAGCWAEAKSRLTELIVEKQPNPSEVLITDLLAGEQGPRLPVQATLTESNVRF
jgi:hypothetical protein